MPEGNTNLPALFLRTFGGNDGPKSTAPLLNPFVFFVVFLYLFPPDNDNPRLSPPTPGNSPSVSSVFSVVSFYTTLSAKLPSFTSPNLSRTSTRS